MYMTGSPAGRDLCYPHGAKPETGIYGLGGNGWEWCTDWYSEEYYAACKKRGVMKDPLCEKEGWGRVQRGGAYYSDSSGLVGARRGDDLPYLRNLSIGGFRLVLAAES